MSETKYEPGTVAVIGWQMTSGKERAMFDGWYWHTESGVTVRTPESVRVLAVLDLDAARTHGGCDVDSVGWVVGKLRGSAVLALEKIADQIEAQTKPARIPEPGSTGSIVKDSDRLWVKAGDGLWICLSDGQSGSRTSWPFLENPTLIREGVSE